MPASHGRVFPLSPQRGKLQNPAAINLGSCRVNGYAYNNVGNTLNLTTQNTWYEVLINQQVPVANEENVSPATGGAVDSNPFTILQAGWVFVMYNCPATGLDSAQTYEMGLLVNGTAITSGLDRVTGATSYTFGLAGFSGSVSAGLNMPGYYNFSANDTVQLVARCTTASSKSLTFAINACAFNPMGYAFEAFPYNVRLADESCVVDVATGRVLVTQDDDYVIRYNSGANNYSGSGYTFARITQDYAGRETRRLVGLNGQIVPIRAGSYVDLIAFKQNPAGNTAAPWTVNASHYLDVVSARSSLVSVP